MESCSTSVYKILKICNKNKSMKLYDHGNFCQQFYYTKLEIDMSHRYVKNGIMSFLFVDYMTTITLIRFKKRNIGILCIFRFLSVLK